MGAAALWRPRVRDRCRRTSTLINCLQGRRSCCILDREQLLLAVGSGRSTPSRRLVSRSRSTSDSPNDTASRFCGGRCTWTELRHRRDTLDHPARDDAARSRSRTATAGANVVATVEALLSGDIRSAAGGRHLFDLGGIGSEYTHRGLAIHVSRHSARAVGWVRVTRFVAREEGTGPFIGSCGRAGVRRWLGGRSPQRAAPAARYVYHPWYARPDRLCDLLSVVRGRRGMTPP